MQQQPVPMPPEQQPSEQQLPLRGRLLVLLSVLLVFLIIGVVVGTTLIRNSLQSSTARVKWSFTREHEALDFPPIVANGMMYAGLSDGRLYALDAASGSIKRSFQTEVLKKELLAPPTLVNGIMYISSRDETLYALDTASGIIKWSFKIIPQIVSPLVANGLVYVGSAVGGPDGFNLTALDASSGKEKWAYHNKLKDSILSSFPAVANGIVYAKIYRTLYALDASSGKERWSYMPGNEIGLGYFAPVIANGTVYINADDSSSPRKGWIFALDASSGKRLWSYPTMRSTRSLQVTNGIVYVVGALEGGAMQLEALNARSGSRIWSFLTLKRGDISSLVAVDGMVYIYDAELNTLNALDESSGVRKWSRNGIFSSPLVVNSVVYASLPNGTFSALDAHAGSPRWSISQWNNNQPLMVNGIIYLFSKFKVWAIQPPA
ncbi:hypothetical protein KSF_008210 [Reticulibacter mediterranei]|uniref:Pyrrolo-quinoline quinone repeat domain-containing protein n=1 Tax=Reticulibacter mediterranei TaxID=2778369 RepID=A0A8J3MZT2_9CHLR|nr:PQQ-binding-like beta-propeller repeat protein [Reticulibacter mediterranei]GHO90773.1 hypothetical protein KSF_008210 [Reticulibacter mediterranei]